MSTDDVARAIRRMAHEILEKNHGCDDVMIVGKGHAGFLGIAHLVGWVCAVGFVSLR